LSRKVAIIGAGASGLFAAIVLAQKGMTVDLFEANDDVGKKILASGNGRCNISNEQIDANCYKGMNPSFTEFALERLSFRQLERFFNDLGLYFDIKNDGKAYPLSNEAKSVVLALKTAAQNLNVTILTSTFISKLSKTSHFILSSDSQDYDGYEKVLIATGSQAAPQLGSNDSGHIMAQTLGHSIMPMYPVLVQLELEGKQYQKISGVKQHARVELIIDGAKEQSVEGDILFTRYGISGFAILDISEQASYALLMQQKVELSLNLMPRYDRQHLANQLSKQCKEHPNYTLLTLLCGIISTKIAPVILEQNNISVNTLAKDADSKMIKKVVNLLLDWRFRVNDTHGFKHAEVSGGGISTFEVDPKTMQSTLVDGLFFSGELLDVVGKRGGYNFHFAWASGRLAALAMLS